MEAMLVLLVLGFFLGWGLGIAGFVRAGGLRRRVEALETALRQGTPLADIAPAPPSPWARPRRWAQPSRAACRGVPAPTEALAAARSPASGGPAAPAPPPPGDRGIAHPALGRLARRRRAAAGRRLPGPHRGRGRLAGAGGALRPRRAARPRADRRRRMAAPPPGRRPARPSPGRTRPRRRWRPAASPSCSAPPMRPGRCTGWCRRCSASPCWRRSPSAASPWRWSSARWSPPSASPAPM